MTKKNIPVDINQLSFFDVIDEAQKPNKVAISLFDGQKYDVYPIEPWMAKIEPKGEYYMLCGGYTYVLCEGSKKVPPEFKYRHYDIKGGIYAAVGIGRAEDTEEETEEEPCENNE